MPRWFGLTFRPNSCETYARTSFAVAPRGHASTAFKTASRSATVSVCLPPRALRSPPAAGAVVAKPPLRRLSVLTSHMRFPSGPPDIGHTTPSALLSDNLRINARGHRSERAAPPGAGIAVEWFRGDIRVVSGTALVTTIAKLIGGTWVTRRAIGAAHRGNSSAQV
jgi:hypothetical protein